MIIKNQINYTLKKGYTASGLTLLSHASGDFVTGSEVSEETLPEIF